MTSLDRNSRALLLRCGLIALAASCVALPVSSQTSAPTGSLPSEEKTRLAALEERLNTLDTILSQTQKALQQSVLEIDRLHAELADLRSRRDNSSEPLQPGNGAANLEALHEQQEIQQSEIKQHDQTKVESTSKYPIKVTGLALFNAFSNAGVVDSVELPSIALGRPAGAAHGSLGATLRQTVLGLQASGPMVFGARSSASINADFFGGSSGNSLGYTTPSGVVRLRDAQLGLDWTHTSLQAGNNEPIFSPLSPTSFAEVAMPSLSGSGNLWAWVPQISVQQRLPVGPRHGLFVEGGLIVPLSPGYTSVQLDSPAQASRRPGVEGRLSYHADRSLAASTRSLAFGISGYSTDQLYSPSARVHSWAITADYQLPLGRFAALSGELYRGRSLGGYGGGLYKDVLIGTDPITHLARTVGIDTAGGWTQLKLSAAPRMEANAIFGLDDAFSRSFDAVVLPASATAGAATARNSSVIGNIIFRPFQAIILSPEYRRISTWSYSGPKNLVNIYTLSLGYQF